MLKVVASNGSARRASACEEEDLVEAARGGSRLAFQDLVVRYQRLVFSIAFGLTGSLTEADEVAQETFIAAWRDLHGLRRADRFRSWICRIARRRALHVRHPLPDRDAGDAPLPLATLRDLSHLPSTEPSPLESMLTREEEDVIRGALEAIPEPYRVVLALFYQEGKSIERVAEILELSIVNVKQRLFRGRKMIHARLLDVIESALTRMGPRRGFTAAVMLAVAADAAPARAAGVARSGTAILRKRSLLPVAAAGAVLGGALIAFLHRAEAPKGQGAVVATYAAAGLLPRLEPSISAEDGEREREVAPVASSPPDEKTVFAFDFEEGVIPAPFHRGHIVPCPARSPSPSCAVGVVDLEWPQQYVLAVTTESLATYSRDAVLSFDYWNGDDDPDHDDLISIAIGNASNGRVYGFWLRGYAAKKWNHAELPLSSFVLSRDWLASHPEERTLHQEDGDRIGWIGIHAGWPGGAPGYIDNLRMTLVAPQKQKSPGSPIPPDWRAAKR